MYLQGFIIAFTSEFIPRLVYRSVISQDGSLNGYMNHTLAYFNTTDFPADKEPRFGNANITMCRYPDYREPPWSSNPYERSAFYWYVLAARLAFVVIFEVRLEKHFSIFTFYILLILDVFLFLLSAECSRDCDDIGALGNPGYVW